MYNKGGLFLGPVSTKLASTLFVLAFLFFPFSASATNGYGVVLEADTGSVNPSDGATYYAGYQFVSTITDTTRLYLPLSGTITAVSVDLFVGGTLSSGEDSSIYLRLNNTTDVTITTTAETNAQHYSVNTTGLSQAVSAGDYIHLKFVNPSYTTNPTAIRMRATVWIEQTAESGTTLPSDANGYLKNDGAGTLTWDNASTVKSFLSLSNVENTALSTWAGTSNITTLGTISTGTWQGTDVAFSYLDVDATDLGLGNVENTALSTWTGSTSITTLGTIATGVWQGTIIDSAYLDISGSGSLPADAEGFLWNDGAGALDWLPASAGDTIVEDDMLDALAILLYFGAFATFFVVAFYRNKK